VSTANTIPTSSVVYTAPASTVYAAPTPSVPTSTTHAAPIPFAQASTIHAAPFPSAQASTIHAAPIPSIQAPAAAPNPSYQAGVPQPISAAASSLAASLQACLGGGGPVYGGLTMDHLRANLLVTSQASSVLAATLQDVAPLQQHGLSRNQVNSVDQLYKATTVDNQLKAFEFASCGQFSYHSQMRQDNVNAVAFAYGSF